MHRKSVLFAIAVILALAGCGGGGGNNSGGQTQTTPVKFDIAWQQRSRVVNAVASSLSAVLTLKGAGANKSDFTFSVDRLDAPAAYTQTYTSTNTATAGTHNATITFYANKGGQGAVVGIASKAVTIKTDGTGIGDIDTVGTVASVTVVPGQTVVAGTSHDLLFTALDANNNMLAVTPGSATWALQPGGGGISLQVSQDGVASGIAPGTAQVSVTLDGKTSALANVDVVQNTASPFSGIIAEATSTPSGPAVRIRWAGIQSPGVATQQFQLYRLPDFPFGTFGTGGLGGGGGGGGGVGGGGAGGGGGFQVAMPVNVAAPTATEILDHPSPFSPFTINGSTQLIPGAQGCGTLLPPTTDTGFQSGRNYRYQLTAAAIPNGSAGCFITDPIQSGLATPLLPADLITPSNNAAGVDITQFSPTFGSRLGADVFQVEVSTDSTFKTATRIWHLQIVSNSPGSDGVTQSLPQPVNLTIQPELLADPAFANYANHVPGTPAPTIYWRVGARHDEDNPGPVHFISQNPSDPDKTFRYVYSTAFTFKPK